MKKLLLLFSVLVMLTLALASCGTTEENAGEKAPTPQNGTVTLNVYNWGEYISDGSFDSLDTNKAFEEYFYKKHGYKVVVNYTTYATNEDMYSKLKNSSVVYDIVIPSDYMIQKMIEDKMLLSFDVEKDIPNFAYIDSEFKNTYYDPTNSYSVPYTYGMMGVIYNTALVDEADVAEKSWGLMWNEKYKGNILQFNNPRDAFATAMYWKGLDVNSDSREDWDRALELLKEQKPILQGYVNDEIFNKMTSESAAIAPYFVGDFLTMAEEEENLAFYYPTEGVNYFVDAMCIPKNSAQPEIAKEYINFMLSEEAAIANAIYIGYASPNTLVSNSEEYIEAMNEYSYEGENGETAYDLLYNLKPSEVNAAYNAKIGDDNASCYQSFTPEIQSRVNTLWENLKIADSTEMWVHITALVIVASVLTLAIYTTYIKKKRSRDYRLRDKAKRLKK